MITNILLADDHQVVLNGLRMAIEEESTLKVIHEAKNGQEVLDFFDQGYEADLVILDINMPVLDGLQAARQLKSKFPSVKILVLTMYKTSAYVANMIKSGAEGYILKNSSQEELITAIKTILEGNVYYDQALHDILIKNMVKKSKGELQVPLTARERDIIKCLADELTSHQIAERLSLSPYTIETHRKNILLKLHVRSTIGVIKYAITHGLVDPVG